MRAFDRHWKSNNERIGWLMIQLERDENDLFLRQYAEELETRVADARESGCDGDHVFHETACHACYLIRKYPSGKIASIA